MVAVEDVLLYAAVANLVVHIDDGAEGADLVELGRRERGLVTGEQLVNPVGALVSLHDAAMRQLDLLVQTLKLDALVLMMGFLPLGCLCDCRKEPRCNHLLQPVTDAVRVGHQAYLTVRHEHGTVKRVVISLPIPLRIDFPTFLEWVGTLHDGDHDWAM